MQFFLSLRLFAEMSVNRIKMDRSIVALRGGAPMRTVIVARRLPTEITCPMKSVHIDNFQLYSMSF